MSTKEKLIEAALVLFGENGYDATSVRDICNKAGVNNASINYHFKDKRSLYRAVLQHEIGKSPSLRQKRLEGTARERLYHVVRSSLTDAFNSRESPGGKMSFREIANPSAELVELIQKPLKVQFQQLVQIIEDLADSPMSPEKLNLTALSVVGQIDYYRFFHRFIPHLVGAQQSEALSVDALAQHITDFSTQAVLGEPRKA